MNTPKISILIPVYNVEKYIKRCIESVINQTFLETYEIIIVNDCSTDSSINILKKTVNETLLNSNIQIKIVNHSINRGQSAARNTALNEAVGIYTIFIDSDDYIDSNMLEEMYDKAIETNSDIVLSDIIKEYPYKSILIKSPYYKDKNQIIGKFIRGESIYLCNKLIKRSLYSDNNLYFKEGYDMSEDYTMMIPLSLAAKKIEYISKPFYHYIQYNTSATTKKITKKEITGWLYSVEHIQRYLQNDHMNIFELDLMYRKLIIRYWCMLHTKDEDQKLYSQLYPEIDSHTNKILKQLPLKNKIILYTVCKKYVNSFNLLIKLKKLIETYIYKK